jgi:hypothetical protein
MGSSFRLFFWGRKTGGELCEYISAFVRVQVSQRVCGKIAAGVITSSVRLLVILPNRIVRLFFLFFDGSFEVSDVFFADVFFPFADAVDYLAKVVFEFFIC